MKQFYTDKLRSLRLQNQYTQSDVAIILGIRQEQYSKYESGVRPLPIVILIKLCALYHKSSDEILGLKKDRL